MGTRTSGWAHGFILVDEGNQRVTSQTLFGGTPVAPAIGRFNGRLELFASQLAFGFADLLMVVQKFQEHHPCEHGQAVAIAIQSLVLAHDVACGLDDGAELLGCGLRLGGLLAGHLYGSIHVKRNLQLSYSLA